MPFGRNPGFVAERVFAGLLALLLGGVPSVRAEAGQNPRPPAADFSGVEKLLELTAVLERDQEPTQDQWDALFATPGYAVLLQREFQKDFFVERFKLAFMPSRAEALKEQMKKDTGFRAQFLPHYLRVKTMRGPTEALRTYVRGICPLQALERLSPKRGFAIPPRTNVRGIRGGD